MKKKTTNKKTHNKWKIVAIISLVVNALVVLFLTIGLATPKAKYVSVNAQSADATAYIYKNSNNIIPTETAWHTFVPEVSRLDNARIIEANHSVYFDLPTTASSYLDTTNQLDRVRIIHFDFASIDGGVNSTYVLKSIEFYPLYDNSSNYSVFDATWTIAPVDASVTYYPLGYNSPYCYLPIEISSDFKALLDRYFICVGDNSVIENYQITNTFNPNKYISMTMDSIGLLYDPPYMIGGSIPNASWFGPIYQGVQNNYKVSTLGCLQIPLFFTSNGENFLGIRLYYDVVQAYVGQDNDIHYLDYGNDPQTREFHYTFVYMSYVYEYVEGLGSVPYNIREKVVCSVPVYKVVANYIQYDTQYRNYVYEPFKSYMWLHGDYNNIGVYQASQEQLNSVLFAQPINTRTLAINELSLREVLLYDMSVNPDQINTGGNVNIGNVFSLIRLAFDSLTGILAISIVPGLSIGILLFLPLVLTIIIVIIKLVKR